MLQIAGGILIAVAIIAAIYSAISTIREGKAEDNRILQGGGYIILFAVLGFCAYIFL